MKQAFILALMMFLGLGLVAAGGEVTLTLSSSPGGSVTQPGEGSFTYAHCTKVELRAEADPHYRFLGWIGDIEKLDAPTSPHTTVDSMLDDYEIRAVFEPEKHRLIVSSEEGGRVSMPGEGVFFYEHGKKVELRAHADPNYSFAGWTGDIDTVYDTNAAHTRVEMLAGYSIKALFQPKDHRLDVSSTGGGRVTVPGEGVFYYAHCTKVELRAHADPNYRFIRWTGDVNAIADPMSPHTTIDSMLGDYTIKAVFEGDDHRLIISSTGGGRVTTPGEGTFYYAHCSKVPLHAEPAAGYRFSRWTGDVGQIQDTRAASTSIESMLGNYEIRAEFEPKQYKLTVSSTEGGKVTAPGEGVFSFGHHETVELKTEPSPGYQFLGWAGDIDRISDPSATRTTIEMRGDYEIIAVFERTMYVLSVSSTDHGTVTMPGEGVFAFGERAEVELLAKPDSGYRFVEWRGDSATIADPKAAHTSISILGRYQIVAVFERKTHELALSSTAGGEVIVPGEGVFTYEHCTTIPIKAEAHCGFRFVGWTGDINEVTDPYAASTTIESMLEDYEIMAVFERKDHTLVISSADCGEVVGPGEGVFVYPYCTEIELRVEVDCGYRFVGWTGDTETIADPTAMHTTIEMRDDYEIRARFRRQFPLLEFLIGIAVGLGVCLLVAQ